jgi:hypothetical protein
MGLTGGLDGVYRGYTGGLGGGMARLKRAQRGDRLETRGGWAGWRACCPTRSWVRRGVPAAPRASEGAQNLRDWTTRGGPAGLLKRRCQTPRPSFKLAEYLGNTPSRRLLLFGRAAREPPCQGQTSRVNRKILLRLGIQPGNVFITRRLDQILAANDLPRPLPIRQRGIVIRMMRVHRHRGIIPEKIQRRW